MTVSLRQNTISGSGSARWCVRSVDGERIGGGGGRHRHWRMMLEEWVEDWYGAFGGDEP